MPKQAQLTDDKGYDKIILTIYYIDNTFIHVWAIVLGRTYALNLQDKAMGVAVTAVVCSGVTAFIAARITDKVYGHLKMTVIVLLGISSVFFLWFLLLTTQVIYPTLGKFSNRNRTYLNL